MKKIITPCLIFLSIQFQAQCPWNFTVSSVTGSFSITCANPTVHLVTSNNSPDNVNFLWSGPSFTNNTDYADVFQAGNYTVVATDAVTSCSLMQTFSVGTNTTVPSNTLSPLSMTTACGGGSPVSFTVTALSPTANVQQNWYSPFGSPLLMQQSNSVSDVLGGNYPPGVYTVQTTDLNNGCTSAKTFTVSSMGAFPVYSVGCPSNFSLGCAPYYQTTINIINPISTQTPPATCSYTFLPPTFTSVVTPSVIFGANTSTIVTIPGTWTLIVEDNSNWCRTMVPVVITQNTVTPNMSLFMVTNTLTCAHPTILATATSTTANTNINWMTPSLNQPMTNSLVIGDIMYGPPPGGTNALYGSYTVVVTNTVNACTVSSVIPIYQNFTATPQFSMQLTPPTSSVSCNGVVVISPTVAGGYTVSASMGTLTGTPQNTITNLCYGTLVVCLTQTATSCKKCDSLTINTSLGLNEKSIEEEIFLRPNPASSVVFIDMKERDGILRLFSSDGRMVKQQNIGADSNVSVSDLNEGIYFVEISTQYGIARKKLVIQR